MEQIFFIGWQSLIRTLVIGVLAYVALVLFLRIAGNRTLSKMNAFDMVVTVALGSVLATVILSKEVALADGVLAFGVLIGLQYLVTWTSVRVRWVRRMVTGEPRLLFYHGQMLDEAMRKARMTREEVESAIRAAGILSLEDVEAVVLETEGTATVVQRSEGVGHSSLESVRREFQ